MILSDLTLRHWDSNNGQTAGSWVYILPKAVGEGVGKIRLFFKNSRQNKEFFEKNAFFG